MSEANKKIAVGYIEAMNIGDVDKAITLVAPDAKFVTKGFGNISGTRQFSEMIPILHMFKDLAPTGLKLTVTSATAEGDQVALECDGKALLCTGADYNNQYVMVFTVRDGKIRQLNEYLCTKLGDDILLPAVAQLQGAAS